MWKSTIHMVLCYQLCVISKEYTKTVGCGLSVTRQDLNIMQEKYHNELNKQAHTCFDDHDKGLWLKKEAPIKFKSKYEKIDKTGRYWKSEILETMPLGLSCG